MYIKLGPLGDQFKSRNYSLNLLDKNYAASIPETLARGTLINFFLTGFLVEITKIEFDNIKVDNRTFQNTPLSNRGVYEDPIQEPVNTIIVKPPVQPLVGERYIIFPEAQGIFSQYKNCIAEWTSSGWIFIQPKDKWTIPILEYGISTQYYGTYPSGKWTLEEPKPVEPDLVFDFGNTGSNSGGGNTGDFATRTYVDEAVQQEAQTRQDADANLQNQINNLANAIITGGGGTVPAPGGTILAKDVLIQDTGGYFNSENVEGALQELAQMTKTGARTVISVGATTAYTVVWDSVMVVKHGPSPTSIRAMVAVGSGLRGIAQNLINYNYDGENLTSFTVTFNNFSGLIEIR